MKNRADLGSCAVTVSPGPSGGSAVGDGHAGLSGATREPVVRSVWLARLRAINQRFGFFNGCVPRIKYRCHIYLSIIGMHLNFYWFYFF